MSRRPVDTEPFVDFFIGLDLGKRRDFTALAVLERRVYPDGPRLDLTHMERLPLETSYPMIVRHVEALAARPELRPQRERDPGFGGRVEVDLAPEPVIVVDATGVGVAVCDLFLAAAMPAAVLPLTITSGAGPGRLDRWGETDARAFWTPKAELVSTVQMLLQTGRLRVAPGLPLADVLMRELLGFEVKVSDAGRESYNAYREGTHDDLLLATAISAWVAGRPDREWAPSASTLMIVPSIFAGIRGF